MILSIILGIVVCLLGFLYYRQDKVIRDQSNYIDSLEKKLIKTINDIEAHSSKMRAIDSKGGFESDDEVGQIFKGLSETISDLEIIIKGEESE